MACLLSESFDWEWILRGFARGDMDEVLCGSRQRTRLQSGITQFGSDPYVARYSEAGFCAQAFTLR